MAERPISRLAHERALDEALVDLGGPRAPRRRRRRSGPFEWLIVLAAAAALVASLATMALLLAERSLAERIYPNISIRGVAVGGLTPAEARAAVERSYGAFLYTPVELQLGERVWRPSAEELGLRLELDEALAQAFAFGREGTRSDNARMAAALWEQGADLPLRLTLDQAAAQRYLLQVAAEIEAAPENAALALAGPEIVVSPERWGRQLLVDETLQDLTAAVQSMDRQNVGLRTRELAPRLRDAEVAPIADQLRLILGGPLTLEGRTGGCGGGCRWELNPAEIAPWVNLRPVTGADGEPTYTVSVNQDAIRAALLPLAAAVRQEGELPLVAWNGGNLRITRPGTEGQGLDADQALAMVNLALAGGPRQLDLPMQPIPPPVTESNLATLGITDQVGLGTSSFAKSEAYRITNIEAGTRRMNGVLVPPGGSFSFNEHLGAVDAANGFVEGYAIIDNRTQKEWGGGLCQVSTTVFRAAFFGGLPITERHEHAFRISWYEELGEPPGLDAAIFTPYNDMRFVNDTGNWLLLEGYIDLERQQLTMALYGSPTGRSVTFEPRVLERTPAPTEPVYVDDPTHPRGYLRKSDTARGGIRVRIDRTISQNGQVIAQDSFPTEFKAWPNIFVRGTGQ